MTVFYRKYRPQKFADLVGQDNIKETLLAQLESGKISHGYLFAGPRGTGKTSTARIFAKALNCKVYSPEIIDHSKKRLSTQNSELRTARQRYGEPCGKCVSCLAIADGSHLDLVEIDAASNRGIDEIRDLREKIKLSPVSSKFKVYIIDEAHMLTAEAFNALLKTLEEPPGHVVFLLCTTAANKLPQTIISRLSRFNFSQATEKDITIDLLKIAKSEGLNIDADATSAIAKMADGSFRDAESILDQLAASGKKIKAVDVAKIGGLSNSSELAAFLESIAESNLKNAILTVENISKNGGDISQFIREVVLTVEKVLLISIGAKEEALVDLDKTNAEKLKDLAGKFSFSTLQNIMKNLLIAESEIKIYPLPKIPLILAVCRIIGEPEELSKVPKVPKVPEVSKEEADKGPSLAREPQEKGRTLKKAKSGLGMKSLAEVEAGWGQFLEKVRKVNVHLFALLKSTRPVGVEGDILTIEVFYRFHKDKLAEPKIVKMLSDFWEEILGSYVGLNFVLVAKNSKKAPEAVAASDVMDVSADDLSKLAQEIFSK